MSPDKFDELREYECRKKVKQIAHPNAKVSLERAEALAKLSGETFTFKDRLDLINLEEKVLKRSETNTIPTFYNSQTVDEGHKDNIEDISQMFNALNVGGVKRPADDAHERTPELKRPSRPTTPENTRNITQQRNFQPNNDQNKNTDRRYVNARRFNRPDNYIYITLYI